MNKVYSFTVDLKNNGVKITPTASIEIDNDWNAAACAIDFAADSGGMFDLVAGIPAVEIDNTQVYFCDSYKELNKQRERVIDFWNNKTE